MHRDLGLVREILLEMESDDLRQSPSEIRFPTISVESVNYHLRLMIDAGLIEGIVSHEVFSDNRPAYVIPIRITWVGHDFLDAARDSNVWSRALKKIGDHTSSITFEILKETLVTIAKGLIGI